MTHFAPCWKSTHMRYYNNILTTYYCNNLDKFIMKHQPDLWIHGHVHNSNDYMVGTTRVISNPRGKLISGEYENKSFNHSLSLDI